MCVYPIIGIYPFIFLQHKIRKFIEYIKFFHPNISPHRQNKKTATAAAAGTHIHHIYRYFHKGRQIDH